MLIGSKVFLRAVEKSDLKFLHELINDPKNRQFLSVFRPMSMMDEEEYVERAHKNAVEGKEFSFMICDKKYKKPVGNCGIFRIKNIAKNGEIGITLLKKYQNKGYGTDAIRTLLEFGFESLNMHLIQISALSSNERAVHVYKDKVGFRYDATLRERIYKNGKYVDHVILSMTKKEWIKKYGGE